MTAAEKARREAIVWTRWARKLDEARRVVAARRAAAMFAAVNEGVPATIVGQDCEVSASFVSRAIREHMERSRDERRTEACGNCILRAAATGQLDARCKQHEPTKEHTPA